MNLIETLVARDGITFAEAEELVNETKEAILKAIEEGAEPEIEDIMMDMLGLEPDYLFELLPM